MAANLVEAETVEIGIATGSRPARSNPVNMPHAGSRPLVPVVIDGSGSKHPRRRLGIRYVYTSVVRCVCS